jgi:hypothetical protein
MMGLVLVDDWGVECTWWLTGTAPPFVFCQCTPKKGYVSITLQYNENNWEVSRILLRRSR